MKGQVDQMQEVARRVMAHERGKGELETEEGEEQEEQEPPGKIERIDEGLDIKKETLEEARFFQRLRGPGGRPEFGCRTGWFGAPISVEDKTASRAFRASIALLERALGASHESIIGSRRMIH